MAVIGLDVGTTGVKSTVFDERARVIGHAYREYNLIGEREGNFELDPIVLWEKAEEALKASTVGFGADIRAISVTSFGESFVCMDENDVPLSNSMIYMDRRGLDECREYKALRSEKEIFCECGQFVDPMFAIYKLRWMRKHQPEVLEKTRKLCFIADYMTCKLGAAHLCDYSLAARSAMFDVFKKEWIASAVEFSTIDASILPSPVPSGSVVGEISPDMARALGMTEGVKLIVSGHDQILAALGSGAWAPGDVANGMGTTDCITAVLPGDQLDMDALMRCNLPLVPFMDTGCYVTYAFNMSGGCAVKWFRDTLAKDLMDNKDAYKILDGEAAGEPTGILVIPYLAGGGTPYMDGVTPAAITGLRLGTTRGQLFRAFLEGETYEMLLNIECLESVGVAIKKIVTVGGGSNSKLWMRVRADVFGRSVYLPEHKEAGTLAGAMLCYTAIGEYPSVRDAQEAMIRFEPPFEPRPEETQKYRPIYERYKKFYAVMRALYRQ
jgi:xylulokinase